MNLKRTISFLHRLEDLLLIGLFLIMMLTAVSQIVLRNIIGSGIVWGDTLVRVAVLWTGLMGAMAATRENNHITIDVITRHLPQKAQNIINSITLFIAGILCGFSAFYSTRLVQMEMEFGTMAFAQVPVWACQSVIPAAFGVIAFRCLVLSITNLTANTALEP